MTAEYMIIEKKQLDWMLRDAFMEAWFHGDTTISMSDSCKKWVEEYQPIIKRLTVAIPYNMAGRIFINLEEQEKNNAILQPKD